MGNPFDTPEWKWRLQRWRRAWDDAVAGFRSRGRHTTPRNLLCRECGALVSRGETECSRCQAPVGGWGAQAAGRMVKTLSPGGCPASFLIFGAILAVALFSLRPDPRWLSALMQGGSLIPPVVLEGGQWFRTISYGYLHGNLLHLAFNLAGLWQLCFLLEPEIGSRRLFGVYTLSMLGGAGADLLVRGGDHLLIVGASGALCGLLGAGISYFQVNRETMLLNALLRGVLTMVVYGVVFEIVGGVHVDHLAHAGGLFTGLAVGQLIAREPALPSPAARRAADRTWSALALALLALTVAALAQAAGEVAALLA